MRSRFGRRRGTHRVDHPLSADRRLFEVLKQQCRGFAVMSKASFGFRAILRGAKLGTLHRWMARKRRFSLSTTAFCEAGQQGNHRTPQQQLTLRQFFLYESYINLALLKVLRISEVLLRASEYISLVLASGSLREVSSTCTSRSQISANLVSDPCSLFQTHPA